MEAAGAWCAWKVLAMRLTELKAAHKVHPDGLASCQDRRPLRVPRPRVLDSASQVIALANSCRQEREQTEETVVECGGRGSAKHTHTPGWVMRAAHPGR